MEAGSCGRSARISRQVSPSSSADVACATALMRNAVSISSTPCHGRPPVRGPRRNAPRRGRAPRARASAEARSALCQADVCGGAVDGAARRPARARRSNARGGAGSRAERAAAGARWGEVGPPWRPWASSGVVARRGRPRGAFPDVESTVPSRPASPAGSAGPGTETVPRSSAVAADAGGASAAAPVAATAGPQPDPAASDSSAAMTSVRVPTGSRRRIRRGVLRGAISAPETSMQGPPKGSFRAVIHRRAPNGSGSPRGGMQATPGELPGRRLAAPAAGLEPATRWLTATCSAS